MQFRREAVAALLGEHVHVYRIDLQPHGLATVWRCTAVDPADDLLSGDQLVLGDASQGAVDERVGAQLLHDADVDADALDFSGSSDSSKFSGRIPSTRFFSFGDFVEGLAGHRNGVVTQVYAVLRHVALDQVHGRRADEAGDEQVALARRTTSVVCRIAS